MKGMSQIELPMRHQSLKDYRKIKMRIIKTPLYFTKQKKRQTALFLFNYYNVGHTGFEPVTSTLSR